MAIYTVLNLLNEDQELITYYQNAKELWAEIWRDSRSLNVEGLAELLSEKQLTFEHRCGGRHLGQEIMAWSGFGLLYDAGVGFEGENREKALMLKEAFQKSYCSWEVISVAEKAAKAFYLE
jgi:hypothetical protein